MRRFFSISLVACLAVAATALTPVAAWTAIADDPPVVIAPSPLAPGADAIIRAAGTTAGVGSGVRGELQQVREEIPQFGRGVFFVRVCAVGPAQRIRLYGAHGNFTWKVRYHAGRTDVTREVVAGTYRTRRLHGGECGGVRLIVRLQPGQGAFDHVFAVRAVPRSGARDTVSGAVHVTGVLVLP